MEGGPGITGNALEDDVMVADLRGSDVSPEETEANARLIAAAPDLLKAAKYAHAVLDELSSITPEAVDPGTWNEGGDGFGAFMALRAAIAKAEGK